MNARLSLVEVRDRIAGQIGGHAARVGHCYEVDFLSDYAKSKPAVWVAAQRLSPTDDGTGYTGRVRQGARVEFVVRLVVNRHADGKTDAEAPLNELHDLVAAAVIGWLPTGCDMHCVWVSSQDGPPDQAVLTCDLIFVTRTTYQRAAE